MILARLLPGPAAPPIGLDLDGGRARAATGRSGRTTGRSAGRPPAVVSVRRPDPDAEVTAEELDRLASVLRRRGVRGRDVALAVPGSRLLLETLELPPPESGAPLAELARAELAAMHRTTPDRLVVDVVPLPAARGGGRRTLAIGCRTAELEPLLAAAAEARLDVAHLTTAGLAAATCAGGPDGAAPPPRAGTVDAAVDLLLVAGWRSTELLVRRDGAFASMRVLPELGLGGPAASLAAQGLATSECIAALDPTDDDPAPDPELDRLRTELVAAHAERLAAEAMRSLAYVEQEFGPASRLRVRVAGAGAACPGLVRHTVEAARSARPEVAALDEGPDDGVAGAVARGLAADAAGGRRRPAAGRRSARRAVA